MPGKTVIVLNPTGAATPSPVAEADSGSGNWWVWLLIALLVVVMGALLFSRRGKRGPGPDDWRTRAAAAYAKGSALHDALAVEVLSPSPAGAAPGPVPPPGDTRWDAIARLADEAAAGFHGLETGVPSEAARTAVTTLGASLPELRSAVRAYRLAPSDQTLSTVRARMAGFEEALSWLKLTLGA